MKLAALITTTTIHGVRRRQETLLYVFTNRTLMREEYETLLSFIGLMGSMMLAEYAISIIT